MWLLITVLLAIKAFAFSPVPDELAVRSLGWPLLMAALLVPYMKRSQRVKGTFTER
ncbi:Inner membrane protein YdgK [compost metagenome]